MQLVRVWRSKLEQRVLQEGLVESRPTLRGISHMRARPSVIFMGIGLCTQRRLSRSLPVDTLGMLLPAEGIRRSLDAPELLVLVADTHAVASGFDELEVALEARRTERALAGVSAALGLRRLRVLRASSFHHTEAYRRVLAEVQERAPAGEHPYFLREVADIAFLHREREGLVKVGWTLSRGEEASARDERAFDRRARAWLDDAVGYVYCRPGRALDDARPRAAPYLAPDPATRICLDVAEQVQPKLEQARGSVSAATLRGALRHYRTLAASYSRLITPLTGTLPERLQAMVAAAGETGAPRGRDQARAGAFLGPYHLGPQPRPSDEEPTREEANQCGFG